MKNIYWFLLVFPMLFLGNLADAQVTNLTVNGFSSNFTMVQGDTLKWEYNLPVSGTAECEIWIDLNGNGVIDPASDKQLFGTFTQTDGIYNGDNGPGDMDSVANGRCFFAMANFGFAPAKYILKFTNNDVGQSITGTVTALPSPAFTVSGRVILPVTFSLQNILVQTGGDGPGWMALTDVDGNYIINFNVSVSGQQMKIKVVDQFPPYAFTPSDTTLTMTKSYTGINFTLVQPAAKVVGYLKGEDGHVFANAGVSSYPQYGGNSKDATTDINGFFQFGYTLSEITSSPIWGIQSNSDGVAPAYFPPRIDAISLHQYDSLRVDLIAYVADDSITGKVTLDGHAPGGTSFRLYANAQDSGQTNANADPNTGNFTLHVTKKIHNYYLGIDNLSQKYGYDWNIPPAQPGDKNVIMNVYTIVWLPQISNTSNSLKSVSFVNSTTGWVAGLNGTMLKTTDAGATWLGQTTNTSSNINGIYFYNNSTGWLVGDGGIIKKTTNGGDNWTSQNSTIIGDLKAVQFIDENIGWAVGGSGQATILKTTDGGTTWTSQNPGYSQLYSLSMVDASIGWAVGSNIILKTTDGGSSWNSQSNPFFALNSVRFADANTGWAVGVYNIIYKTTDGGTNWTTQSINVGDLRSVYCIDNSTAWIVGQYGYIYRTTNGGSTWTKQPTNTSNNLNAVWFVDANNGWAVGDDGTILHTTNGGSAVTSVWENKQNNVPSTFALSQNYPNPFNPVTNIEYRIANAGVVSLKVYDILGREVATLVNEQKQPGRYTVSWDAGRQSSGIYFCRMKAGQFVKTMKLLLVK